MKRCFVSFYLTEADSGYKELTHLLKISLECHSKYDVIIYTENDFIDSDIKNKNDYSFAGIYKWKYFCIKRALTEYDEVIWMDSDIIVNHRIDNIWDYFENISNFPLLPNNRFSNYINPPLNTGVTYLNHSHTLSPILHEFSCNLRVDVWLQACLILVNRNCLTFINEMIPYLEMGVDDEHLFNLFYNKYNLKTPIDGIFVCSHFFKTHILSDNMVMWDENTYLNFMNNYVGYIYGNGGDTPLQYGPLKLRENNFNKIMFWHGNKDVLVAKTILIDTLQCRYTL